MKKPIQRRVRYIGGIKNLFTRSTFYISILNFAMLAATSYVVVVKEFVNVPFWVFLLVISGLVLIAMVFEYVVMLPSETAFLNWQSYEHENPIRTDLEEIKEELKKLKEIIKEKEK